MEPDNGKSWMSGQRVSYRLQILLILSLLNSLGGYEKKKKEVLLHIVFFCAKTPHIECL